MFSPTNCPMKESKIRIEQRCSVKMERVNEKEEKKFIIIKRI
jgi:hypothetical protein